MSATAIIIISFISLVTGIVVGFACGNKRGRDEQWIDDFIEHGLRERARRNSIGQFKKKEKT